MKVPKLQKQYLPIQSGIGIQSGDPGAFTAGIGQLGQKIADVLGQQYNIKLSKQNRVRIDGEKLQAKTEFYNLNDQYKEDLKAKTLGTLNPNEYQGIYEKRVNKFLKDSTKKYHSQTMAEVQGELMWESRLVYDEIRDITSSLQQTKNKDLFINETVPSYRKRYNEKSTAGGINADFQSFIIDLNAMKNSLSAEEFDKLLENNRYEANKALLSLNIKTKMREELKLENVSESLINDRMDEGISLLKMIEELETNGITTLDTKEKLSPDNPVVKNMIDDITEELDAYNKATEKQGKFKVNQAKKIIPDLIDQYDKAESYDDMKRISQEIDDAMNDLPLEERAKYDKLVKNEVAETERSIKLYRLLLDSANQGLYDDYFHDKVLDYVDMDMLTKAHATEIISAGKSKKELLDKTINDVVLKNNLKILLTELNGSQEMIDVITTSKMQGQSRLIALESMKESMSSKYNQKAGDAIQIYLETIEAGMKQGFTMDEILSNKLNVGGESTGNLVKDIVNFVKSDAYTKGVDNAKSRANIVQDIKNELTQNQNLVVVNGNPAYLSDAQALGYYFSKKLDIANTEFDNQWRERRTIGTSQQTQPDGTIVEYPVYESIVEYSKRQDLYKLAKNARLNLTPKEFTKLGQALGFDDANVKAVATEIYKVPGQKPIQKQEEDKSDRVTDVKKEAINIHKNKMSEQDKEKYGVE